MFRMDSRHRELSVVKNVVEEVKALGNATKMSLIEVNLCQAVSLPRPLHIDIL